MLGMTNEQVIEFNRGVIETFRAHEGVMPEGPFHNNPTLLLTMTGPDRGGISRRRWPTPPMRTAR